MRHDLNYSTTAAGLPYIPKVIPISSEGLRYLHRWQRDDIQAELEKAATESGEDKFASIAIKLDSKEHRRRVFTALANTSGWLVFGLLTVTTPPRISYLLYAAISSLGEWVDGLALESLFDFATSVRIAERLPYDSLWRLELGLECHRQLSLAHWQPRRKRLLAELEDDLTRRYCGKVAKIEGRLKDARKAPQEEACLSEDRAALRKVLLNAEATEGETAQFLIRLHAEHPKYELKKLFTIEWTVESAKKSAPGRPEKPTKKNK